MAAAGNVEFHMAESRPANGGRRFPPAVEKDVMVYELLTAKAEENIQGLVYGVTHDKVKYIREEFVLGMLATLDSRSVCTECRYAM